MNNFLNDHLAYFITFTTYGTWLPGDERGWTSKTAGDQTANPVLSIIAKTKVTENAVVLSKRQRELVENTIGDHCLIRGWQLYCINCRTNHVHTVVATAAPAKSVRREFKAWCSRRLGELVPSRKKWWSENGSCRYINDEQSLDTVIKYVRDAQDRKHLEI